VTLHARLGVAVILVAAVGSELVLLARARPGWLPTVRVFVRLCAVAAALEAAIGLGLLVAGNRPAQGIHLFYGAATVLPVPAAQLLARRVGARDELLYLLAGTVAIVLFGIRAITTGGS